MQTLDRVFMMCQAPQLLKTRAFSATWLLMERETKAREPYLMGGLQEEGVVSSTDNRGGMERRVGSLFLQRALKTEKRDVFVKEIPGFLKDWGGLSAT